MKQGIRNEDGLGTLAFKIANAGSHHKRTSELLISLLNLGSCRHVILKLCIGEGGAALGRGLLRHVGALDIGEPVGTTIKHVQSSTRLTIRAIRAHDGGGEFASLQRNKRHTSFQRLEALRPATRRETCLTLSCQTVGKRRRAMPAFTVSGNCMRGRDAE